MTRNNAARMIKAIRRVYPSMSPWDICLVAASMFAHGSAEYIHIREVAIKFPCR